MLKTGVKVGDKVKIPASKKGCYYVGEGEYAHGEYSVVVRQALERGQDFLYYTGVGSSDYHCLDFKPAEKYTSGDFFYEDEIIPYKDERIILGYKLIRPELIDAVTAIGDKGLAAGEAGKNDTLYWMKDMVLHRLATISIRNLEEIGVLNLWFEPVYEEKQKTYTLTNGQTVIVNKDHIVAEDKQIPKSALEALLPAARKLGDWDVTNVRMDIGCWKNVTSYDIKYILKMMK